MEKSIKLLQKFKSIFRTNINNFQVITQRVLIGLGYPKLAAKLKIGGDKYC